MASVEWFGDELAARLREAASDGVTAAAIHFQGAVTQALSRPGTPTSATGFAQLARGNRLRGLARGAKQRSRLSRPARQAIRASYSRAKLGGLVDPPGGMPRKRTGALARSIVIQTFPGEIKARVGPHAGIPYAAIHEFGGVVNAPGGQPYLMIYGQPRFIRRSTAAKFGRATRFTKPHNIHIPARPYMRPTFRAQREAMVNIINSHIRTVLQ